MASAATRSSARRGAARASGSAKRAGKSDWVAVAGRVGHIAKGVSYALIAVLALQVAFGQGGGTTDREGVLRQVAGESFGTVALWLLAFGFAAYAFWQLVRAVLDRDNDGTDPKGLAKRGQHGLVGVIYVASAVAAVSLATGSKSGTGGSEQQETARVLEWPGGQWIVGIVGAALFVYGLANVWKAKTQKFRKDLNEGQMDPTVRTWSTRSGVIGYAARGVVFALIGFFLTKAAVEYDPDEAIGIDGALRKLADQTYGTWLLGLVAAGLLAYAVFCVVQARYRRM
jgi:hypothetical protein